MLYEAYINTPEVAVGSSFSVRTMTTWPGDELAFLAHKGEPVSGIVIYANPIRLTVAIGTNLLVCRRWRLTDNLVLKLTSPTSSWTVTDSHNERASSIRKVFP